MTRRTREQLKSSLILLGFILGVLLTATVLKADDGLQPPDNSWLLQDNQPSIIIIIPNNGGTICDNSGGDCESHA